MTKKILQERIDRLLGRIEANIMDLRGDMDIGDHISARVDAMDIKRKASVVVDLLSDELGIEDFRKAKEGV